MKTEYKIVAVVLITNFIICDQNHMEKLLRGLKKILVSLPTQVLFNFFQQFSDNLTFKIRETFRKFFQSTMVRKRVKTWPLLINPKKMMAWDLIFTEHNLSDGLSIFQKWSILFKIYQKITSFTMLKMKTKKWPLLVNLKHFEPAQHCSWGKGFDLYRAQSIRQSQHILSMIVGYLDAYFKIHVGCKRQSVW